MTYFVGDRVSSIYHDPDQNNPEDFEYYLSSTILTVALLERLWSAFHVYKNAEMISPEVENREIDIIGTNDIDIMLRIKAELQHLGVQYSLKEDYTFHNETELVENYGSDNNVESIDEYVLKVSCKYMFALTSSKLVSYQEKVMSRTNLPIDPFCSKNVFLSGLASDEVGLCLPHVINEDNMIYPENDHYSTEIINEDFLPKSETIVAVGLIIDVMARTFDDNFFYMLLDRHEEIETKSNTKALNDNIVNADSLDNDEPSKGNSTLSYVFWTFLCVLIVIIAGTLSN
jgi:hypothetical protein